MKERLRDMEAKVRSSNLHLTKASKGEEREVGEKHYLKIWCWDFFKTKKILILRFSKFQAE